MARGFRFPSRIADIARIWPEMETPTNKQVGRWEQMIALLERRDQAVEDWMNTLTGGKEYATVVVAASDSHQSGKDNADFVCTGVNDQTTIQAAFDSIPLGSFGIPFGRIILLEGVYQGAGDVSVPLGVFELQGMGGASGQATFLLGIGFVGTGVGPETGGYLTIRDLFSAGGQAKDFYILSLHQCGFSTFGTPGINVGAIEVIDSAVFADITLTFPGTFRAVNSGFGLSVPGDKIHGSVGSFFATTTQFGLPVDLGANPAGIYWQTSNNRFEGQVSAGQITIGAFDDYWTVRQGGEALILTDCNDTKITGYFEPSTDLSAVTPRTVKLVATGTPGFQADNVVIEASFFRENTPVGGNSEYQIEVGAGVTSTKLICNYYGATTIGDVLDNGTGTVRVDCGGDLTSTTSGTAALFQMVNEPAPFPEARIGAIEAQLAMIEEPLPIPSITNDALLWMGL